MSRPAIFRIKLGVRVPIVLGAISNLALAGFYRCLFVFVMSLCVVLWLGRKKDSFGEEKYFALRPW